MKLYLGFHFLLSVWEKSCKTADQKAAELKLPNIKEFFIQLAGLSLFSVSLSFPVYFFASTSVSFSFFSCTWWFDTFLAFLASTFWIAHWCMLELSRNTSRSCCSKSSQNCAPKQKSSFKIMYLCSIQLLLHLSG